MSEPTTERWDLVTEYLEILKLSLMDLLGHETLTARRNGAGVDVVPLEDRDRRIDGHEWPANALTMIGLARLNNIQFCLETVLADGVPGDFIETGVWRGGASIFARAVLRTHDIADRSVWVADSFEGLPPPEHAQDADSKLHEARHLMVSLDEVKRNFDRYRLLDGQVQFLKGFFRDTLPGLDRRWSVIRLDGDMYDSTIVALESLYPSLSPGGFLIVDDFKLEPCRKAVEDYRALHGISEPIERIDWTGVFWRKR